MIYTLRFHLLLLSRNCNIQQWNNWYWHSHTIRLENYHCSDRLRKLDSETFADSKALHWLYCSCTYNHATMRRDTIFFASRLSKYISKLSICLLSVGKASTSTPEFLWVDCSNSDLSLVFALRLWLHRTPRRMTRCSEHSAANLLRLFPFSSRTGSCFSLVCIF